MKEGRRMQSQTETAQFPQSNRYDLERVFYDTNFLLSIVQQNLRREYPRRVRRLINIIRSQIDVDLSSNERQKLARRIIFQLQKLELEGKAVRDHNGWRLR